MLFKELEGAPTHPSGPCTNPFLPWFAAEGCCSLVKTLVQAGLPYTGSYSQCYVNLERRRSWTIIIGGRWDSSLANLCSLILRLGIPSMGILA